MTHITLPLLGLAVLLTSGAWGKELWKWQVSLQWKGAHECGGVLYSPTWIVTSASCFNGSSSVQTSDWKAVVGFGKDPPTNLTVAVFARVVMHSFYTMQLSGYDIALVQLNASVIQANQTDVGIISIPATAGHFADGFRCKVTGWGKVHKSVSYASSSLQSANVTLLNSGSCNRQFQTQQYMPNITFIWPEMICSNFSTGPGTCMGDTGGPLVCNNIIKGYQLVGILSWNMGCSANSLGVYTNAAAFSSWITTTISTYS